jgi:hypothetical protein
MRFSDFLLVSDPADLDFIVGYADDQNIRIDVADFFADNISGTGNPGYIAFFTSNQTIGNSQLFQDGSNIVIGGVNAMGYRLAIYGGLYAANGASIQSTIPGSDTFRTIGEEGDSFIIPHDEDESIWTSRCIIHAPAVLTTESATLGQLNTAISNLEEDIDILLALKVDKTSVGVPNGVASLDAGGKVPLSQIPDSIIGQVQYMGTWNALTNTPTLNFLVPEEKGHYYVVSVAGVFGGIDFQVGDWIISNGTYWEKVDNTDAVTSVFGRIGAILALEADYQSFYPRLSQAYDNPTWINTLAFSKITGVPPFLLENQTITLSGDVTGSGKTSISTTISDNAVTDSKLRNSVGTSVIGRASSTTGDPADIQATTDGHVLLRSGGNLLFGLISSDSIGSIDWSKITNTPTTLSGYGIADAYTKTEADNKFVPYTGANANVNLGSNNITANSFIKAGGTSAQFLKADGSVDTSQYVPTTRSINAGTGLTGGGNLSSDVNIAFDTTWGDTRYAYRTRQLTINGTTYDLSADRIWNVGTVTSVGLSMPSAFTVSNSPVIGAGVLTVVGAGTILEYVRGDGSLATFPSLTGYVPYTGATQDVNLGTYGLISDFVRFNTSSSNIPSAEGVMSWDNTDGTVRLSVKGNTYSVPIGQSVVARVRNSTGTNLLRTNYQVVKVAGAQGQRLAVSLAQANNDANSASTLGLVCENISTNQEGFIVNIGQIVNVNTTGNLQGETWLDGDVLYLSPTIAGAITNIKPVAPQHTVILGYVEYAHANNGKIYVKIDNGYELEELHDVSAEPFINNGLLYRDTTLNLWKSATISTILGYTPAPQGNYITSLTGEATASGPGAASVTLSNSAVTGKVLTGLNIAGNEILSTDSILTAFGKLQHQVNQLVGGLQYEGTWNASTNTPTITSSVGTDGTFYIVSVAGTTNINGINDWEVGDWIVFHDTAWQKVDNSDSVSSVFGRVGNIVANQADYSAFYPLIADIKNGVLTVQGTGVLSGSGTFSANQATNNTISLIHSAISRTDTTSTQTPSFGGSFNVVDSITSSAEGHVTEVNTKTVTIPSTVASASQTGLLSSANWSTFNSKQNAITLTTTGTSGPATLVGATLNIPNYAPDLSGYVTLGTDQTITGLKTIVRSGDVLNFKIGTDTLYGLKVAYNQNELVPSGEATWSFVNTFNRNGVGYETTPISFFRGVLVTGERLLSASINSNLLDYYGNNPSGRYPVYAYNTGVQQFSTGIIVGKTTGVVNAGTGAIADLPAGVVANFNGRVIGGNAVNSNEFVTLSQLGSYVPTSRTLTINGVTFDLSANRSWTITAGVSGVTATSPLFSSGGSTPNITIQQASGSQGGFLSSTDWTTFNNKANANGSNASGTWGISITGNAATVGTIAADRIVYGGSGSRQGVTQISDWNQTSFPNAAFLSSENSTPNAPTTDFTYGVQTSFHRGAPEYRTQFVTSLYGNNVYWLRQFRDSAAWSSWVQVIHSGNFNSYSPTLTGGGASGTWGINITGSAGSAGSVDFNNLTNKSGGTGTYQTSGDFRAPIFYDSNNTGFYADLNSTGTSINIAGSLNAATFNKPAILVNSSGTTSAGAAFGMQQVTSEGWTGIFVDFEPNTGWGLYHDNPNNFFLFTAETTTGQIGSGFTVPSRLSGNRTAYTKFLVDQTTGDVIVGRVGTAQQDFRAPIFYDSNNTGFYLDPNSTGISSNNAGGAVFRNIQISSASFTDTIQNVSSGGNIWLNYGHNGPVGLGYGGGLTTVYSGLTVTGTASNSPTSPSVNVGVWVNTFGFIDLATSDPTNGSWIDFTKANGTDFSGRIRYHNGGDYFQLFAGSNEQVRVFSNNAEALGSFRAPTFFDSNDTAYYIDPASDARLRALVVGYSTPSSPGVFRVSAGHGDTSIRLTAQSLGSGSSPTMQWWVSEPNITWDDGGFGYNVTNDGGSPGGFGRVNTGWGQAYMRMSTDGSWRFYNTNTSGTRTQSILLAPSGAALFGSTIQTGSVWINNGNNFNAYDENIRLFNAPNGVSVIAFSASGVSGMPTTSILGYSDRMEFRYGNGAQYRIYNGYTESMGSSRAPIFYDSDNTGYYLNPNGGSYFAGSLELANGYFLSNGIGGAMYMTSVSGSFGGYLRTSGHMVLDQMNAGYNVYVLDGNSVGVVKNAGSQSWSAFSDATIKTVHSTMEDNLSKLQSITPIYYSFNNFADDKNRIGLIAQEVQEHFPELVEVEPRTEKLTLDYTGLIPVLLGAIKELKTEIETLKTQL